MMCYSSFSIIYCPTFDGLERGIIGNLLSLCESAFRHGGLDWWNVEYFFFGAAFFRRAPRRRAEREGSCCNQVEEVKR